MTYYSPTEHERKTVKHVLSFNQESLISQLLNIPIQTHKRILSPFRMDNHPNCYFEWYHNKLRFVDWADKYANIDVIGICQRLYNCSLPKALDILYDLWYSGEVYKQETYNKQQLVTKEKTEFKLTYTTRDWTELDKKYFGCYGIDTNQLNEDNIYSVQTYTKTKNVSKTVINTDKSISYAIQLDNDKTKICNPFWKEEKWITTCKQDDLGLQGVVQNFVDDRLIITKSYKDSRIQRNMGYNSIYTQNEGQLPKAETLEQITRLYSNIFVLYDNDNAGIQAANKFISHAKEISPTTNYQPIFFDKADGKDTAQLYIKKGRDYTEQQLYHLTN